MQATEPIKEYVLNQLLQRRDLHLDDDTPLIEDGYLTSLQTVELVMFLEEHFQIQIEPEDVNEEEFQSLKTIASLVESKRW